jgi:hypothetical protein
VLGDWLQEQGDPRGQLIALQLAGKHREALAMIDEQKAFLLGPLAEHAVCYDHLYHDPAPDAFEWSFGFIHAARISYMQPWVEAFEGEIADVLEMLLRHPSGRFLAKLTLMYNNHTADHDLQPVIDVLVRLPPPTLRELVIGDKVDQISWYQVGDLGKLWSKVPGLERLDIEAGQFDLGKLDLPALRHAVFETGGLSRESGRAIAAAKWPKIERLDVFYGDNDYGGECNIEQVKPLLARTDMPALRHLAVCDAVFADQICAALPNAKLLPQLKTLDLSKGIMTDDGAKILAANKSAFVHLDVLDVSDNYLTKAGIAALRGVAKKVIAIDQKDDDGDPEFRYVTVGE